MRCSRFSGFFYPSTKEGIIEFINKNRKEVVKISEKIKFAIVPHAGWDFSGRCALYVYENLRKVDRVIAIGTNHSQIGKIVLSSENIKTPLGIVRIDDSFVKKILINIDFADVIEEVHENEHSIEVQLPFLQHYLGSNFRLVPILVSNLNSSEMKIFSDFISEVLDLEKDIVIFSGDMIHHGKAYGFTIFKDKISENVRKTDLEIIKSILDCDLERFLELSKKYYTVCGFYSFQIFIYLTKRFGLKTKLLCYYNSGEITKKEDLVVGYASLISHC